MPRSEVPLLVAGLIALVLVSLASIDGILRVRRLVAAKRPLPAWIRVEFVALGVLLAVGIVLVVETFFAQ